MQLNIIHLEYRWYFKRKTVMRIQTPQLQNTFLARNLLNTAIQEAPPK
jgi:hypothetical protein